MLAPMSASSTKAIQGPNFVSTAAKRSPRKYPSVGIRNWKPPNQTPQISAWDRLTLRTDSPLQMETAKASIERLMAIRIRSNKVMIFSSVFRE